MAYGRLVYAGLLYADNFRHHCVAFMAASINTGSAVGKLPQLLRKHQRRIFSLSALWRIPEA